MGALGAAIVAGATILAVTPATAERYDPRFPVCLQKWEWGGSNTEGPLRPERGEIARG
jgi:hypothetical protein